MSLLCSTAFVQSIAIFSIRSMYRSVCQCFVSGCGVMVVVAKGSSPSQAIEDPKKKTSLLKDRSWIRSNADQDEAVE